MTLLFEDAPEVSQTVSLAPNSRTTVTMDGPFAVAIGKRFSTVVESIGATPAQIVIERAMYSDSRGMPWGAGLERGRDEAAVRAAGEQARPRSAPLSRDGRVR